MTTKISVINPNSTVSMTDKIAQAAREAAPPDVEIEGRTCAGSPPSIQGAADGELAAPHLLAELQKAEAEGADAVVIACFDDTALAEARKLSDLPIVGIGEAGYHAAILMGKKFSVVTTLSVSVPVLEQNLEDYGLTSHCLKVRASEVPVLDLEKEGSDARAKISDEIGRAIEEDGAEAIVLGCAGMADLAAALSQHHGVPVIDGVAAATGLARMLIGLRP
ncbi:aspartate/glutamate racemase family protein [Marinibacterium profundimaris]|uniref:aspartate/glutamate racemase family protein n=1 Tax=Marinibacterium profundimaris TaxID=1679460 RepID=UPI000B523070|nr:aspartate/glutamate racemase family protein [Marinibacterium profundimaris]